jgi:H+/Na+-translocating ferredoxin:NAD+ oxidoreductase subunit G
MASKTKSSFINMVLALAIVTGVAAVSLGAIYNATKGPIEKAKQEKLELAISNVLPEFDKLDEAVEIMPPDGKDPVTFYKAYKGDEWVGTAVKTYTDNGFSGRFWIMVGFAPDGSIVNTAVLEHKETPGLGDKMDVSKSDFPLQFMEKNPTEYSLMVTKDGGDVDAITAATISSRAFCDALQRAYDTFIKEGGTE